MSKALEFLIKLKDDASSKLSGLISAFGKIGLAINGVKAAFQSLHQLVKPILDAIGRSLESAFRFESLTARMQGFMGGMRAARNELIELTEGKNAIDDLFDLKSIVDAARSLRLMTDGAMGGAQAMKLMGEVALATGNDIATVANIVGFAWGKLASGEDIGRAGEQLVRAGILTRETLNEIEALAKSGASFSATWSAFTDALKKHEGAIAAVRNTTEGYRLKAQDASSTIRRIIGESLKPYADAWYMLKATIMGAIAGALDPYANAANRTADALRNEAAATREAVLETELLADAKRRAAAETAALTAAQILAESRIGRKSPAEQLQARREALAELEGREAREREIRGYIIPLEERKAEAEKIFGPAEAKELAGMPGQAAIYEQQRERIERLQKEIAENPADPMNYFRRSLLQSMEGTYRVPRRAAELEERRAKAEKIFGPEAAQELADLIAKAGKVALAPEEIAEKGRLQNAIEILEKQLADLAKTLAEKNDEIEARLKIERRPISEQASHFQKLFEGQRNVMRGLAADQSLEGKIKFQEAREKAYRYLEKYLSASGSIKEAERGERRNIARAKYERLTDEEKLARVEGYLPRMRKAWQEEKDPTRRREIAQAAIAGLSERERLKESIAQKETVRQDRIKNIQAEMADLMKPRTAAIGLGQAFDIARARRGGKTPDEDTARNTARLVELFQEANELLKGVPK